MKAVSRRTLGVAVRGVGLAACLLGVSSAPRGRPNDTASPMSRGEQEQLMELSRRRFAAFVEGDRTTYRKIVSEDAIFAYSNGRVLTYADALAELTRLAPPGSYEFRHEDVRYRSVGDGGLLVYRLVVHGPAGIGDYEGMESDLFRRTGLGWKMVAVHGTTIPYPTRPSIGVDTATLDAYVGRYEGEQHAYYDITRRGTRLIGQRSGFDAIPWIAESNDVFYVPSDPTATRIFLRDEHGRVSTLVRIDASGDVRWKRTTVLPRLP